MFSFLKSARTQVLSGSDPFVDLGSWRMGCADHQQLRTSAKSDKEIDFLTVDHQNQIKVFQSVYDIHLNFDANTRVGFVSTC